MISVLLVDDQPLIRAGLRAIIDTEPDLRVIGEANDGSHGVEMARALAPDVVLMDVRMPRLDGIAATRLLLSQQPSMRILMLTTFDVDDHVLDAIRAGASGYLLKDTSADQLIAAIRNVHAGDAALAPSVTRRLLTHLAKPADNRAAWIRDTLSARELDVLLQLARGLSNAEIAHALFLAETTVKSHVQAILTKLDVRDRLQAAILAHDSLLATPHRVNRASRDPAAKPKPQR